ncbi:MAG: hypothetical protein JW878_06250 [Methanomicrobia archaeon]|nr:hypothetical protein [Methanomicrobia archaeon]
MYFFRYSYAPQTIRLALKSDRPVRANAAKIQGFFATRFTEYALLHQHVDVNNGASLQTIDRNLPFSLRI